MANKNNPKKRSVSVGKTILGWLIFLAVLAAFFFGVRALVNHSDKKYNAEIPLCGWAITDIASFEYTYEGKPYGLTYDAAKDNWTRDDDPTLPIGPAFVAYMMKYATELEARTVAAKNLNALEQYGLADPTLDLTLTAKSGESLTYHVSEAKNGTSYLYKTGDTNVYTVDGSLLNYFGFHPDALVSLEPLPEMSTETVKSITIASADGKKGTLTPDDKAFADTLGELEPYWFYYIYEMKKDDAALRKCGLDAPTYTITVNYAGENGEKTAIVTLGSEIPEKELRYATSADHEFLYSMYDHVAQILLTATGLN